MTAHVPRHRLERLGKGRPEQLGDAAAHTHVAGCDHCAVRKRALDAASQRYLAEHPPLEFARAVLARAAATARAPAARRPLRGARLLWPAAALAVVAALAVLVVRMPVAWPLLPAPPPPSSPPPKADAIRLKGAVSFEVYARHGGRILPVQDGVSLAAGDQLAFAYRVGRPTHLLLLGIDARGAIRRYYPAAGLASTSLVPGPRAQLPVGVELDQRKGAERIVALFSTDPLDEAAVRGALAAAFARAGDAGVAALARIDVDAEQVSAWFRVTP